MPHDPDAISPFSPGQPVAVELFVGRVQELERLRRSVRTSVTAGRVQVAFMVGERGIGKSSAATFLASLSEQDLGVLPIHCFLSGASTLNAVLRRVLDQLLKKSINAPWYEKLGKLFGKHIRQVGLFGVSVEFSASDQELRQTADSFAEIARQILERLDGQRRGLLIILDDINGVATDVDFANWLKNLVDEVATDGRPLPVSFLICGFPERHQELIASNPSLGRVIDCVEINPWSEAEAGDFFRQAFARAGIAVHDSPIDTLAHWSGGLPVVAHEIGDATFYRDQDGTIDEDDASDGVIAAARNIGSKYVQPQVLHALRSRRYRTILRQLSQDLELWKFTRAELAKGLSAEDRRVLDNFLRRMRDLRVIAQDEDGGAGSYRFCQRIHHVYLWLNERAAQRAAATAADEQHSEDAEESSD